MVGDTFSSSIRVEIYEALGVIEIADLWSVAVGLEEAKILSGFKGARGVAEYPR